MVAARFVETGHPVDYHGVKAVGDGEIIARPERHLAKIGEGEAGDVVLFHTGWLNLSDTDPVRFMSGQPGLGVDGAKYLAQQGVVAVGADTWALEVLPAEIEGEQFPVHPELLAKNGVYILENMVTEELIEDGVDRFMFVLGQARLEGAVQMIINPVAIR